MPGRRQMRERPAVPLLAIAVVIVAVPCRPGRRVCLEHRIDDLERGEDCRIVRGADTVADEFEKAAINNVARGKIALFARRVIGDVQQARFFVFGGMLLGDCSGKMRMKYLDVPSTSVPVVVTVHSSMWASR